MKKEVRNEKWIQEWKKEEDGERKIEGMKKKAMKKIRNERKIQTMKESGNGWKEVTNEKRIKE